MEKGLIVKAISGFYYVDTGKDIIECKARGIFRKKNLSPLVGDNVSISIVDEEEKKGIIEEVFERKSELIRPPVANIDKVLITFAVKEPKPNLSLLDRFIVFSEREGLDIVILLTKTDLDLDGSITKEIEAEYSKIGYKVISVSNEENINIDAVKEEMKGCISVFAGQSGVGKSSILNSIDPDFNLKTSEISQKLGRGKHTTRHAELFRIGEDSIIADTPGFSSFELNDIDIEELQEYFIEFKNLEDCRFGSKCIHKNEPDCEVKNAVEEGKISRRRYESYLQIMEEINNYNMKNRRK